MNFMGNRPGFYEDAAASRGFSSSSSSSSPSSTSFHRRNFTQFPPYYPAAPPESAGDDAPDDSSDDHLLRGGDGSSTAVIQREHMFDKVVTPSDVGKLNRLVIPKQHAEKYFPLDSSANEKGLLLNFEDRNGKPWRFRYSYWNSSQSYVMTKGWSRFVKEKKLDAGDIVSFQRGVGELARDRLFIDWRRRPDAPPPDLHHQSPFPHHHQFSLHRPWGPLFMQPPRDHQHHPYSHYNYQQSNYHHPPPYAAAYGGIVNGNPCPPGSIMYLRSTSGGGRGVLAPQQIQVGLMEQQLNRGTGDVEVSTDIHHQQMVFDSVPVVQGKAAAKRLRLFGVNMDCPISESDDDDNNNNNNNNNLNECDILMSSSSAMMLPHFHHHQGLAPSPPLFDSSQYSSPSSLARLRSDDDDKGKGSMSLDLDI